MTSDSEIWRKVRLGDADTFESFYRENAPRLRAFLYHMVGSPHVAEDLMQETFTQIWKRPNGFHPERGNLRAYLFGIGRKRAAEWWRSHDPKAREIAVDPVPGRAEAASVVGDAFERLPDDQRQLLWLREVEGQSYAELAEILAIPVGTVRSRLFAAREALRTIWNAAPRKGEL